MEKQGILFIVSGPAGSGKGTVVSELRKIMPDVGVSVSATTRAPRPGEVCGVNYHFTTRADFEGKIAAGEVLEYTEYLGNYYGTLRSEGERRLGEGRGSSVRFPTVLRSCGSRRTAPRSSGG